MKKSILMTLLVLGSLGAVSAQHLEIGTVAKQTAAEGYMAHSLGIEVNFNSKHWRVKSFFEQHLAVKKTMPICNATEQSFAFSQYGFGIDYRIRLGPIALSPGIGVNFPINLEEPVYFTSGWALELILKKPYNSNEDKTLKEEFASLFVSCSKSIGTTIESIDQGYVAEVGIRILIK